MPFERTWILMDPHSVSETVATEILCFHLHYWAAIFVDWEQKRMLGSKIRFFQGFLLEFTGKKSFNIFNPSTKVI